ncbi:MAG: TolC family protein, partial [Bacteroidota bacterium]
MGLKTRAQAPCQRDLNLQEALQRAQTTWVALKVDSLNILAAQRERRAHPMLDAAQFNSEWGQINSAYRDQGLQINQTFRLPAVYKAQGQLAQARLEGARLEKARSLQQLERDLISTYYAYLVLLQKRILLQHNDSLISETVGVLQQRYQRGQISGSDLNQILLIQGESSISVQKVELELDHTLRWFQYLTASDRAPSVVDSILWTSGLGLPFDSISSPDLDLLANLSQEAKANSEL